MKKLFYSQALVSVVVLVVFFFVGKMTGSFADAAVFAPVFSDDSVRDKRIWIGTSLIQFALLDGIMGGVRAGFWTIWVVIPVSVAFIAAAALLAPAAFRMIRLRWLIEKRRCLEHTLAAKSREFSYRHSPYDFSALNDELAEVNGLISKYGA